MADVDINTNRGVVCPCPAIGESKWEVSTELGRRIQDKQMIPLLVRNRRFVIYVGVGLDSKRVAVVDHESWNDWMIFCSFEDVSFQARAVKALCLYCDYHERELWARSNSEYVATFLELNYDVLAEKLEDLHAHWTGVGEMGIK